MDVSNGKEIVLLNYEFYLSDCDIENVNIKGLRSELTSVVERSRKGDLKQMELEHTITRLQEEISSKTAQLVELNDRLNDKAHLVESLERKLDQKNGKLLEYQKELSKKDEHYEELESQVAFDFIHDSFSI